MLWLVDQAQLNEIRVKYHFKCTEYVCVCVWVCIYKFQRAVEQIAYTLYFKSDKYAK